MTYDEALEYIHSLGNFSRPVGLERIKLLLSKLGDPQKDFSAIHISGTNGKGSVSVMTASALRAAGYKTGLYISPYVINFRERIGINGEYISEGDLIRLCLKVKSVGVDVSEFEFITAVGFLYFSEQHCDVAVVETGLGGRFDATNVFERPLACAITKIGLDHTAVLGDTIEKITAEKCGIIKDCPVIINPRQPNEALEVINKSAERCIIPEISQLEVLKEDITGNEFLYKGRIYTTRLAGSFQTENAVTAIELLENCGLNISYPAVKLGLASAFIPARLEVISQSPAVVLDGAHNPDGAKKLAEFIKKFDRDVIAIIGMMKDKDYKQLLAETIPFCKKVIAVKAAEMPRTIGAERLADAAREFCSDVVFAESYAEAISAAGNIGEGLLVVFGSLYLASGIRPLLINIYK